MFGFVNYRSVIDELSDDEDTQYCLEPDLPETIHYKEIVSFAFELNWGLFEIDIFEDEIPNDCKIELVSEKLETLLYSAKDFPPALAMLRKVIRGENFETKADFEEISFQILENFLDEQSKCQFLLAKCIKTDTIERRKGGYYWIVGYAFAGEAIEVEWVVWDYYIYRAPIEHFALEPEELERRFGKK